MHFYTHGYSHVYKHVYTHFYTHLYIHVYMHVYTRGYLHVYIHVYTHVYTHVSTHVMNIFMHSYLHTWLHTCWYHACVTFILNGYLVGRGAILFFSWLTLTLSLVKHFDIWDLCSLVVAMTENDQKNIIIASYNIIETILWKHESNRTIGGDLIGWSVYPNQS